MKGWSNHIFSKHLLKIGPSKLSIQQGGSIKSYSLTKESKSLILLLALLPFSFWITLKWHCRTSLWVSFVRKLRKLEKLLALNHQFFHQHKPHTETSSQLTLTHLFTFIELGLLIFNLIVHLLQFCWQPNRGQTNRETNTRMTF